MNRFPQSCSTRT